MRYLSFRRRGHEVAKYPPKIDDFGVEFPQDGSQSAVRHYLWVNIPPPPPNEVKYTDPKKITTLSQEPEDVAQAGTFAVIIICIVDELASAHEYMRKYALDLEMRAPSVERPPSRLAKTNLYRHKGASEWLSLPIDEPGYTSVRYKEQ